LDLCGKKPFFDLKSTRSKIAAADMPPPPTAIDDVNGAYLKRQYLMSYNAISTALWFGVLGRVAMFGYHGSLYKGGWLSEGANEGVYEASERYTRLTQTVALLEVVHSLVGTLPPFSLAWKIADARSTHESSRDVG
jgi:hypothetical protein